MMFLVYTLLMLFQNSLIKASVIDGSEKPISYASVYYKGHSVGTATDAKGNFQIQYILGDTLIISCEGYKSRLFTGKIPKTIRLHADVMRGDVHTVYGKLKTLKESLSLVEINNAHIEQIGALNVADVVEHQPGVQMTNDNGIMLRGFDPRYTLILIDGEPLLGAEGEAFDLSELNTENIEKIEILKGPSSFLYGKDALAGSVNIITKKASKPFALKSGIVFDSFEKHYDVNGQLEHLSTQSDLFASVKYRPPIHKEVSLYELFGKYHYKMSDELTFKSRSRIQHIHAEQDTDHLIAGNERVGNKYSGNFNSKLVYIGKNAHHFSLNSHYERYYNEEDNSQETRSFSNYSYLETYLKEELKTIYLLSDDISLNSNIGLIYSTIDGSVIKDSEEKTSTHYYGLSSLDFSSTYIKAVVGFRYDNHTLYEPNISKQIGTEFLFFKPFTIGFSVGEGYKTPTFRELFGLSRSNSALNYVVMGTSLIKDYLSDKSYTFEDGATFDLITELHPETSRSYNLSFKYEHSDFTIETAFFRNELKNHIKRGRVAYVSYKDVQKEKLNTYYNIERLTTEGFELSLDFDLSNTFKLNTGYTYTDSYEPNLKAYLKTENSKTHTHVRLVKNVTVPIKEDEYLGLFDRSKHVIMSRLSYIYSLYTFSLSGQYFSPYGKNTNENRIYDIFDEQTDPYVLVNLNTSFNLDSLKIGFKVSNILNQTNKDFNEIRGRSFNLKISYNIY